jgi:TRAP-type uncharacterized transport system substrate-binding protein
MSEKPISPLRRRMIEDITVHKDFSNFSRRGKSMLGLSWSSLLKGSAAILCILAIVSFALLDFIPAPPSVITMAVGSKGGSYEVNAACYKEILARDHVNLELRNTAGGAEHFKLLQDKNSGVQVAMAQGGTSDSEKSPGLLSIGRINYQVFCIFLRATDALDDLTPIKGKRIAVGPVGWLPKTF